MIMHIRACIYIHAPLNDLLQSTAILGEKETEDKGEDKRQKDTYNKRRSDRSRYAPTMQNHIIESHCTRTVHAQSHHGQTVTDEDGVHSSCIGHKRRGKVMCCEHSYRFSLFIHVPQCSYGYWLPRPVRRRRGRHGSVGAPSYLRGGAGRFGVQRRSTRR